MKPSPTLLRFVNLFCSAMLSGGLILTVAALRPALSTLPMSAGVLAQQLVVPLASWYMPVCGGLCAVSAIFLIKRKILSRESARFYKIGFGCMVATGLMSIYIGGVLDKEIGDWPVNILANDRTAQVSFADKGAPGSHHLFMWNTWGAVNAARTVTAVAALCCFITANIQPRVYERQP